MMKIVMICGLAALLVGCLSNDVSRRDQYSLESAASIASYKSEALRLAEERDADPGFARVSTPARLSKASAFMPGEWFVCLRGIPEHQAGLLMTIAQLLRSWFTNRGAEDIYEIVLFFPENGQMLISEGYDVPVCDNLEFELIVADPAALVKDARTISVDRQL
jgi:hypothetical protein